MDRFSIVEKWTIFFGVALVFAGAVATRSPEETTIHNNSISTVYTSSGADTHLSAHGMRVVGVVSILSGTSIVCVAVYRPRKGGQ
jgi:hypothetical protein